ncbi:Acetoin:2,6-dichlorophenolindophenol oxidoreductase subunit alpha [uncultured delta proteobacterium]|uniref:Acetoin:2,6-dichlorophenolindophenol oxidoreductase subunit alpha n=1 Tax=uncultured delta proteobacterium TaxID=34034 RepID=A0A212JAX2_9DELT|nr:Acetoin:2,6-dichlorophenolindophenol oxidoreductase subunit alpha [uncultured delta proteobacterium]
MFERTQLLQYYETMHTIREFEMEAIRLRERDEILGTLHTYIGEEAIATAVCACLKPTDYIESTHRGHGHTIAKGADVKRMMAELFGRITGSCKGKGGSMHIADFSIGMLGANGIVGGGYGLAVGAALAARFQKRDAVSVVFFGDGASNRGTFHEAANMAAAWKLPVIFVCENNGWAAATSHDRGSQQAVQDIAKRAVGYDMESFIVNGNDFFAVYDAMSRLAARARNGEGNRCGFLECKTFRIMGHYIGDKQPYRDAEIAKRRLQADDCIVNFENRCLAEGWLQTSDFAPVRERVLEKVREAKQFAIESPYPDPAELYTDIYDA